MLHDEVLFLRKLLPDTYDVIDCSPKYAIRCKSVTGLRTSNGNDDDEHWLYVKKAIKEKFHGRLQEIYFNTCTFYQDFVVYLRRN